MMKKTYTLYKGHMEILVQIKSLRNSVHHEVITGIKARRMLNGKKSNNSFLGDDGSSIVREFIVELDDYSDEDIKEYEGGTHE